MQKLNERAPILVATAILLGIISHALTALGIKGFAIALSFFLLNLALSAVGLATRKFRVFWLCWSAASLAFFLLFGMTTPVGMALILPRLAWDWL